MSDVDSPDSGRFDLPMAELRGMAIALLTRVREAPELGEAYLDDTFRDLAEEDYSSALRLAGRIAGQVAVIFDVVRSQPAVPGVRRRVHRCARSGVVPNRLLRVLLLVATRRPTASSKSLAPLSSERCP